MAPGSRAKSGQTQINTALGRLQEQFSQDLAQVCEVIVGDTVISLTK
jgi:hypothetical protein